MLCGCANLLRCVAAWRHLAPNIKQGMVGNRESRVKYFSKEYHLGWSAETQPQTCAGVRSPYSTHNWSTDKKRQMRVVGGAHKTQSGLSTSAMIELQEQPKVLVY